MATLRTAQSTLDRFRRIRPVRRPQASRGDDRRLVVADIDGGGARGGLSGSPIDMLAPAGPVQVAGVPQTASGGLIGTPQQPTSPLQSGLQLAQSAMGLKNAVGTIGGLLGGGGVGAGPSGLGTASAAGASPFAMAPTLAGPSTTAASGLGAFPVGGATGATVAPGAGVAPVVEPVTGLGGAVAAGGLAAAAPALAFGLPALGAAIYSQTTGPSKARAGFKVNSAGEIVHRNVKDSNIGEKAAFNAFADWVGDNIRASGAKVPDPGDISFGVRGRQVYLQPAGGGERMFFNDPRDLLSALTEAAGSRRDFSGVEVPDFSEAGRQAAAAEADRLTQVVGGRTSGLGGPLAGDIFEPTGMIGRLRRSATTQGLINQPEFLQPRPVGGLVGGP